ncbi:MAG TPA: amino acid adenylation domain-containing protein, partial [Mycobacterium sp.]|nr:amino acid adenylation domain-containing protein [Mycobacterium sp.]
ARWQRDLLGRVDFDAHVDFWKKDLAGAPPLELDTDRPRPKTPTFRGARVHFDLGRERAAALSELCRTANVTVSVPLLAALATVLNRYTGQDDLVIGTLTANRPRIETEDLIGLFVNSLPVRIRLDGDPDVSDLLDRIRQRMVEVLEHQDVPFDLIVNATAPDRDANRNPLFSVQLVVQPGPGGADLSGRGVAVSEVDTQTAKRDLTFTFSDDELLTGHVEYASELFDTVRIERLIAHFNVVLDAMLADPRLRVAGLPMLTPSERAHYEIEPSRRAIAVATVPELFETTVDRAPEVVAVSAGDEALTYRELDIAANRLAHRLRNNGVESGTPVGLCVGRTVAIAIGMLGILKAGGVYVPIDPSYPQERIAIMLDDAGIALVLSDDDVEAVPVQGESTERLESAATADDLAYIMYTSGSTGRPKGVAVSHRSVVEYAETLAGDLGVGADDVYLETAASSFSSSIRQMLVPLAVGAQVVIASTEERRDPARLLRRIHESGVTIADLVPTVVRGIVDTVTAAPGESCTPGRLRLLLTASEPLRAGVVREWRDRVGDDAAWVNMYGQTETTGIVSLHRVGELAASDQSIVPIGRPRGNVGMYVLDEQLRPVPPGVSGQLFIAGTALARGYLGDPALTARKFVFAPWNPDERLYASGDMVRLGWDGTVEFRNRTDRQVKIRGLRVEPAEIDRVLLGHDDVREAVTVVQDGLLVAYFTPAAATISASELRAHVRRQLPEHMVPSAFMALDSLPQTPNGKLDRTALPEVEIVRDQEIEFIAPRPGVEESLAEIWRSTLEVDQIGAADNFFSLGGHSLLAAQVRSRIHQLLGVELPLDAFFEDQTLADLAVRIEETKPDDADAPSLHPAPRTGPIPASYAQELMWQAECDAPGSPTHWIDVSVRIAGRLDASVVVAGVQEAARRHELLRTTFEPTSASSERSLVQVIRGSYMPEVPVLDAMPDVASGFESQWRDLGTRPPFRAEVVRIADDNHVLRLRVHRILADGYAIRLLLSEIGGLVASSLGFNDFPLLDGDLQYADYAAWERSWLTGDALSRRVEYFRGQFADASLPAPLPTAHPRFDRPVRQGAQLPFEFPAAAAESARALAVREQASLYTVLVAAFASAVGSFANQRTVVIGSPVTRRGDRATQLIIGPFMNTVPLLIDVEAGADMPSLVREVKPKLLGALSNRDAPWQHVQAALTAQHGIAAASIGEIGFLMDDPVPGEFTAGGFTLTRVAPERVVARRDLTVAMSTRRGQITGTVTYDVALFEPASIERLVTNFIALLSLSESRRG